MGVKDPCNERCQVTDAQAEGLPYRLPDSAYGGQGQYDEPEQNVHHGEIHLPSPSPIRCRFPRRTRVSPAAQAAASASSA